MDVKPEIEQLEKRLAELDSERKIIFARLNELQNAHARIVHPQSSIIEKPQFTPKEKNSFIP